MDKHALMASLTGPLGGGDTNDKAGGGATDQDLFGNVPTEDEDNGQEDPPFAAALEADPSVLLFPAESVPPPSTPTHVPSAPAPAAAAAPPPVPSAASVSLLSKSGLLGFESSSLSGNEGGGGGGGLFEEVDQEEEQKLQEQEEEKRRVEAERLRLQQQKEEEENLRRQQEEQARQQQQMQFQQQQQQRQQQQQYQPQQQQQQQQQPMYGQQSLQYSNQNQNQNQPNNPSYQQQSSALMQSQSMMQSSPHQNQHPNPNQNQQLHLNGQMQSMTFNQYQQQPHHQQQQPPQPSSQSMSHNSIPPSSYATQQPPPPQQQQQQQPQYHPQPPTAPQRDAAGFYRDHMPSTPPHQAVAVNNSPQQQPVPSNSYGGGQHQNQNQNQYYYGTQAQPNNRNMQSPQGSMTAGMHNSPSPQYPHEQSNNHMGGGPGSIGQVRKMTLVRPPDVQPIYTNIQVTEPMLIQTPSFLMSSPPYWSYQINSQLNNNGGIWLVRRRFRHVVALEDRLRQAHPGAILPPRPEKHGLRPLDEGTTLQSAEFAVQRAQELQHYLNSLGNHPIAGQSPVLKLFLGLQDDIGTAWAEVSNNALTRLGAVGVGVSVGMADKWHDVSGDGDWEPNAELLALQSSETVRMAAVAQAVPKLEGTITLLRDQGDAAGHVGMELSKLAKQQQINQDEDVGKPSEILSNGLLRQGRRQKRLALELTAATQSFLEQYKLVPYEKWAFQDRKVALQRRSKERKGADQRATMYVQQQRQLQSTGQFGQLDALERTAVYGDQLATNAQTESDEIATRITWEVNRVAIQRRTEWLQSMKIMASALQQSSEEKVAIWESTQDAFLQAFPEYNAAVATTTSGNKSVGGSVGGG
jgi:hypothetical protein